MDGVTIHRTDGLRYEMPIYEYVCLDCHKQFNELRPMSDADAPIACLDCEGEHTSRTISVFFAQSGGRVVAGGSSGCASCGGGVWGRGGGWVPHLHRHTRHMKSGARGP